MKPLEHHIRSSCNAVKLPIAWMAQRRVFERLPRCCGAANRQLHRAVVILAGRNSVLGAGTSLATVEPL